jgi:hypothetical protein
VMKADDRGLWKHVADFAIGDATGVA